MIGCVAVCVGNLQRENLPEAAALKRTFPPVIGINSSARSGRFLGSLLASWESAQVKNRLGTGSNTCAQKRVSTEAWLLIPRVQVATALRIPFAEFWPAIRQRLLACVQA